ncbi:type II secretion system minor pseudopilin GspJ [Sphingomonas sp.]|uniref:type II secretion system minor pseudopilin GspJ n=1 Tax=Sphingomonas sp. TaxID=28214 RepID=UPI001DDA086F|nr:type II secretion system minor pseudopilin GspJ [Sphingomonas sp.]MBX9796313.1 type II secretion system minor pseudopilin GspJ [Sphingomonas sp.]
MSHPRRHTANGFTPSVRSAEHGFTPSVRSAEHGFTLVEVIVALFIFGLIAAAGVGVLSYSVRAQAISTARLDDIGAIERLKAALGADLAQAVDRPTRDAAGLSLPGFLGAGDGSAVPMLALVRTGWTNPDGVPRAEVQRVDYLLRDGQLLRQAYPMLDGAAALPPAVLLDEVSDVRARYRLAGAWSDRWTGQDGAPLPQAVELQINRRDGRSYRLALLVGTGYAPPSDGRTRRALP